MNTIQKFSAFICNSTNFNVKTAQKTKIKSSNASLLTLVLTNFFSSLFQFVIVSLKDGMFNNANVLFRTKFVEGMSTVTRTTAKDNAR